MSVYIVTVKLAKNPKHDPQHKVTGMCPFSIYCTDSTGEHHSFVAEAEDEPTLRHQLRHTTNCDHVTRIEKMA